MFWNSEFLNASPSNIDVLLQNPDIKLSDLLFEDDLLQELKTSNANLTNFLTRPEVLTELVDNITQLNEKDCCDKLLRSRVHAAYISCEILTAGSQEIFAAFMSQPEYLDKIICCLAKPPPPEVESKTKPEEEAEVEVEAEVERQAETIAEATVAAEEEKAATITITKTETTPPETATPETTDPTASKTTITIKPEENNVVPKEHLTPPMQKATLVSRLISTIHSGAPDNLSCHLTKNLESFSELINVLICNIDFSGAFEILATFINRTAPPDLRYVFCELMSKLNFVINLIDVMTKSDIEDKQRNACQLLCDIIVIGRQEASEQTNNSPMAQDTLAEILESKDAVHTMLEQMWTNTTAIVCGLKVLQTLVGHRTTNEAQSNLIVKTIEQIQDEIDDHLIEFHRLLLNPPKLEPIKTTFGIIQKPLGYIRLEVVNLIKALIGTNSPKIIRKLVELRTMKVIMDLFIEYSWNNLLHTQVEQALCLIIKNCRHDEDRIDMQQHINDVFNATRLGQELEQTKLVQDLSENENNYPDENSNGNSNENSDHENLNENLGHEDPSSEENICQNSIENSNQNMEIQNNLERNSSDQSHEEQNSNKFQQQQQQSKEIPSRALLSQLLNECDLIGKLLLPTRDGEQANFGHIIQIINSVAINGDLDTIRNHLNEMKDKRPELYDRWTTFVSVDVASFKEISLFFDVQSANNHVDDRYGHKQHNHISNIQHYLGSPNQHMNSSSSDNHTVDSQNVHSDDMDYYYYSFTKETVIPSINVDVLPKARRSKNSF